MDPHGHRDPGAQVPRDGPRAALTETGLALALLLLVDLAAAGLVRGLGAAPTGEGVAWLFAGAVRTTLAAGAYAALARALGSPGPLWSRAPAGATVRAVILGAGAAIAGSALIGLLLELLGLPPQEQEAVLRLVARVRAGDAPGQGAALVLSAGLLAPAAEEWFFRGLLFRRLLGRAGPTWAYGLSAGAFALIHGNWSGLAVYAWLGLCFAFTYRRTGRLGAAIAVHVLNNAAVLALLFAGVGL